MYAERYMQPSPAPVGNWGSLSALVFFRSQATAAKYALPIKAA